jgi:hypothetical protein
MTFSQGGTVKLQGKTYNISQINSVYTGSVKTYSGTAIFFLWFIGGFFGAIIIGSITNAIGSPAATILWFAATIIATIGALYMGNQINYAVFFDMSSGKVSAYSSDDKSEVEKIKDDIIAGMEKGYFPNYLQGDQN